MMDDDRNGIETTAQRELATSRGLVRSTHAMVARENFDPEFGVNGRFGIPENLVLDATYNPDFSHVEADAFKITTTDDLPSSFPREDRFFSRGRKSSSHRSASYTHGYNTDDPSNMVPSPTAFSSSRAISSACHPGLRDGLLS
jgi:hypothetical protein